MYRSERDCLSLVKKHIQFFGETSGKSTLGPRAIDSEGRGGPAEYEEGEESPIYDMGHSESTKANNSNLHRIPIAQCNPLGHDTSRISSFSPSSHL